MHILLSILLYISAAWIPASSEASADDSKAYICNNKQTEVYHLNAQCSALRRCTHDVVETTVSAAKEKGLRVCGNED
jgi:hypothetical protein